MEIENSWELPNVASIILDLILIYDAFLSAVDLKGSEVVFADVSAIIKVFRDRNSMTNVISVCLLKSMKFKAKTLKP